MKTIIIDTRTMTLAEALREAAAQHKGATWFMYTTDQNDPSIAAFASLEDMIEANREEPEYCEWLRRARVGESYVNGGGAAPIFTTWRTS